MVAVKLSPKFQIVIPKELRERLKLKAGQKLFLYERNGSLRILLPKSITELRGIAKGIQWKDDYRDHTDRF